MEYIIEYISIKLCNLIAAVKLINEFENTKEKEI